MKCQYHLLMIMDLKSLIVSIVMLIQSISHGDYNVNLNDGFDGKSTIYILTCISADATLVGYKMC